MEQIMFMHKSIINTNKNGNLLKVTKFTFVRHIFFYQFIRLQEIERNNLRADFLS